MFENDTINNIPYTSSLKNYISKLSQNIYDIPNIIFIGGKQACILSIIRLFLRNLFNDSIYKIKKSTQQIRLANHTKKKVIIYNSSYHFEISIIEHTVPDIYIVTNIIKPLVQSKSISNIFKIIVVRNVDSMSKIAQCALRRIIEKSCKNARFFLECNNLSKLEKAIISRFTLIRVPLPTQDALYKYVKYLNSDNKTDKIKKGKYKLTSSIIKKIIKKSDRSIKMVLFYINIYRETGSLIKINTRGSLIYSLYQLTLIQPNYNNCLTIKEIVNKLFNIGVQPKKILYDFIKFYKKKDNPKIEIEHIIPIITNVEHRIYLGVSAQIYIEFLFYRILQLSLNNLSIINKSKIVI